MYIYLGKGNRLNCVQVISYKYVFAADMSDNT